MEMLVGEQKQDRVALLLDPAGGEKPDQPVSDQPKVPDVRETGSECSVSQRSLARPDPGIAGAGCEGVAVVAGHGLA
jgi:hypothetical protein